MDVELIEIQEFLANHPPFDQLPDNVLEHLPKRLSVRYFRRGTEFPPPDADQPYLYIMRRGAVEMRNADRDLIAKLAEGDLCTKPCRPDHPEAAYIGNVAEDTLAYLLPCSEVQQLRDKYPSFAEHFDQSVAERLRKALALMKDSPTAGTSMMTVEVRDLIRRGLIHVSPTSTIREAAQIMTEHRCSSLILMDGDQLAGMITDRDLRSRCLAVGLDTQTPVSEIMTTNLHTAKAASLGFQALLTMTRLNVHHLPVTDNGQVLGVISTTDLTRFQSANSVYLVGDIHKAASVDVLAQISTKVPELQVQLINSGATADHVGQAVSAINDAITQRLLELAEQELGSPPVPYAWLVGGSQARREQSSHSDQDNALLLSDDAMPEDDAYFAALAKFVNDGLDACGYF